MCPSQDGSEPSSSDPPDPQPSGGRAARAGGAVVAFFDGLGRAALALGAVVALVVSVIALGGIDSGSSQAPASTLPAPVTAAETSAGYQQRVGRICDALNRAARDAAARRATLHGRLARSYTSTRQRDVLLGDHADIVNVSYDLLARFESIAAPARLQIAQSDTTDAWRRNARRLAGYQQRLDRARDRTDLIRVTRSLVSLRQRLREDSVTLQSGLLRLGGESCQLEPPRYPRAVALPATRRRHDSPQRPSQPGASAATGAEAIPPNVAPPPVVYSPALPG